MAMEFYTELSTQIDNQECLKLEKITKVNLIEQDIIKAAAQCNESKAIGEDQFFVSLLKDKDLGKNIKLQLVKMLNLDFIEVLETLTSSSSL